MDKVLVRVMVILLLALALLAAAARPAHGHPGDGPDGHLWAHWSVDPLVLLGAGLAGLVYTRGWQSLARRGKAGRLPGWRKWSFAAGLVMVLLALLSPLDALAGQLFWAHMLQHTLLMLAAAPLLVVGAAGPVLLLGLPRRLLHGLGRAWGRLPGLHAFTRGSGPALLAWLLLGLALWAWHVPRFYTAALENENIHAMQHTSFLATGLLFWWVTLNNLSAHPERRGAAVLSLFTTALHSGLLGALITFSPFPWYPVYAGRTEAWGLTALADQQFAGLIMWLPAGMIFLVAVLAVLKPWMESIPSGEGAAPEKELK